MPAQPQGGDLSPRRLLSSNSSLEHLNISSSSTLLLNSNSLMLLNSHSQLLKSQLRVCIPSRRLITTSMAWTTAAMPFPNSSNTKAASSSKVRPITRPAASSATTASWTTTACQDPLAQHQGLLRRIWPRIWRQRRPPGRVSTLTRPVVDRGQGGQPGRPAGRAKMPQLGRVKMPLPGRVRMCRRRHVGAACWHSRSRGCGSQCAALARVRSGACLPGSAVCFL